MNNYKDPYEVLGVARGASDEDITSAYRKLAKRYHPDLNPGDEIAAKKMAEINAAYDSIKNGTAESYAQSGSYQNASGYGYGQPGQSARAYYGSTQQGTGSYYGQTRQSSYTNGNTYYYYRSYGPAGGYTQRNYQGRTVRRRSPLARFLLFYIVARLVFGLLGLLLSGLFSIFSVNPRKNTRTQTPQNPYYYEQYQQDYRTQKDWNL